MIRVKLLAVALVLLSLLSQAAYVGAASGGIVTVSPALAQIQLPKGAAEAVQDITVTNTTASTMTFTAEFRSMVQSPKGSLVPSDALDKRLANVLTVSRAQFEVAPDEKFVLRVTVHDNEQLGPGGHYAALLLTQRDVTAARVGLQQGLSVALFITKQDGALKVVEARQLRTDGRFYKLPTEAIATFRNTGNVAFVPHATINVKDPSGNVISRGVVNDRAITILPDKSVTIQSSLVSVKNSYVPGRYITELSYRADDDEQSHVLRRVDVIVPPLFWPIIGVLLVALVGFFMAIRILILKLPFKRRSQQILLETNKSSEPRLIMDIVRPKNRK